jgi:feruloyl esterase
MALLSVRKLAALGASCAALAIANPAAAADCSALANLALSNGKVTAATLVAPGAFQQPSTGAPLPPGVANAPYKNLPAFCRVEATMTPTADSDIKVEIWLPANNWNGKLVGIGNGIWAGQLSYSQMADPIARGFAAVTTDTGHKGSGMTAEWAVGHPEKLVDFGHRAVHQMTVAAKAAIKAHYGSGPKLSYWNSCSTGGRQGLMAAYRYPDDFDAISAMAPANPMTDLMTQTMWASSMVRRTPESALTPALLGLAHKAAVAKCDALDGLKDGLIGNPQACTFKAAELSCKPGQSEGCFKPDQVRALQSIYDGVRDPKSGKLLTPGWPVGAEPQLTMLVMGAEPFPVANDYFRLLVHGDNKGWDWKTMDYGKELAAARTYGKDILNVPATGLSAYLKRGGKLLLSHGWADGLIPANNTILFHQQLAKATPAAQMKKAVRLFMAPGMDHCSGGEGPSSFDTLGALDAWATSGIAPESIVATRVSAGPGAAPGAPAPALPPMSRPLCPFPKIATYGGSGDTNDAANFRCTTPKK